MATALMSREHRLCRCAHLALLDELCDTMFNGSLCGLGGMTPFPVRSALRHFREDFQRVN